MKNSAILLLKCPDRKGLDAAIADFIYWHGGDILHFEQHQAGDERFYLARVEWDLTGFEFDLKDFPQWFAPLAQQFSIEWRISTSQYRPRVAIFVSKYDHCLVDLLYRQRIGELACEIPVMISNHPDAKRHADFQGIPYHIIPVTKENKTEAERQEIELLEKNSIDPDRVGPIYAGTISRFYPPVSAADHQYPPFVFCQLLWEQSHITRRLRAA